MPRYLSIWLFIAMIGLCSWPAVAQTKSAAENIGRLTNPSNTHGIISCGQIAEAEGLAAQLAALGPAALPDLERALDSIERERDRSPFNAGANWLLLAYAKAEGPRAVERLQRLFVG